MKSRWAYRAVYIILLILWTWLVVGARALSFSMDEPSHIARGYTYLARWQAGFWYFTPRSHPPLLNSAEAGLLFLGRPDIPLETLTGWGVRFSAYVNHFLPYLEPMERTEVLARTPVMLLTLLLGAVVFRWAKDLQGPWAGLVALGLLAFNPSLLAHGRLATTDMGVTVMGTAALYAGWRWLERPTWAWTAATGALLGLTMLSKLSGLFWCAAFGLTALGAAGSHWRQAGPRRLVQAAVAGLLALSIVWAAYGFSFGPTSLLPFPLPAPMYWIAFQNQADTAGRRIFVALGEIWVGTQWWYFPFNFLIKNPIPLLLALPVGAWSCVRQSLARPRLVALGVFPFLYVCVAVVKGVNVSFRHMLPIHPFLWLVVAVGWMAWLRGHRRRLELGAACGLLGAWYIVGTLCAFPDELAYFNELAGGLQGGYRYLVDYTQDWGQSFKQLRTFLNTHPGPEPQVVYFTRVHPGFYGVAFEPLSPAPGATRRVAAFSPRPGRYVMGVAPLYGLVGGDAMELEWFRRARPTAMVGHALFVYDVADQPAWLAQCSVPVAPLDEEAILDGLGRADLRQIEFDCTSAWLYPGGDLAQAIGIYALPHDLLAERERCWPPLLRCDPVPVDAFVMRRLGGARLSYEQREPGLLPAFALYESPSGALALQSADASTLRRTQGLDPGAGSTVYAAPAETQPQALAHSQACTSTVSMTGPLAFLGVVTHTAEGELEVETWWRVTQGPLARPFSIMAHLLTEQGDASGSADGLGVSPLVLAKGDVLVQRHRFTTLPAGKIWLRTGAYWLDTEPAERWAVRNAPGADALFVPLGTLK